MVLQSASPYCSFNLRNSKRLLCSAGWKARTRDLAVSVGGSSCAVFFLTLCVHRVATAKNSDVGETHGRYLHGERR